MSAPLPDFDATVLLCKGLFIHQVRKVKFAKLYIENVMMLHPGKDLSITSMRVVTWQSPSSIQIAIMSISSDGDGQFADDYAKFAALATGSCSYTDQGRNADGWTRFLAVRGAASDMLRSLQRRVALFAPEIVSNGVQGATAHCPWKYNENERGVCIELDPY